MKPRSSQVLFFAALGETPCHFLHFSSHAHEASKDWASGREASKNRRKATSQIGLGELGPTLTSAYMQPYVVLVKTLCKDLFKLA